MSPANTPHPSCGAQHNPLVSPMLDDPHPLFARARRDEPVFFSEAMGAWVVTRHEDICAVARDVARFSSVGSVSAGPGMPPEVLAELMQGVPPVPTLVDSDPPLHTRIRGLANRALSLRRITAFEPVLRATAHRLVDAFVERGEVELVHAFALPLPGIFIVDLLGLPREDFAKFSRWSDDWIGLSSVTNKSLDQLVGHARGFVAFQRHIAAAIEERRQSPRDDTLSDLVVGAEALDPPLGLAELVNIALQIVFAGHETTAGLITALALELARDPELRAALAADPALREPAVEEALRLSSPINAMFRVATEDVALRGVQIKQGDRVQLAYVSGNRDDARFTAPDRFDLARTSPHLAFGHGVHYCIGAPLARLEGRVALEVLIERLPGLRLTPGQTLEHVPGVTVRRLRALSLAWDRG